MEQDRKRREETTEGKEGKKIRKSRSNRWYGMIVEEEIPAYLKEGKKEKRWVRIARFRLK